MLGRIRLNWTLLASWTRCAKVEQTYGRCEGVWTIWLESLLGFRTTLCVSIVDDSFGGKNNVVILRMLLLQGALVPVHPVKLDHLIDLIGQLGTLLASTALPDRPTLEALDLLDEFLEQFLLVLPEYVQLLVLLTEL